MLFSHHLSSATRRRQQHLPLHFHSSEWGLELTGLEPMLITNRAPKFLRGICPSVSRTHLEEHRGLANKVSLELTKTSFSLWLLLFSLPFQSASAVCCQRDKPTWGLASLPELCLFCNSKSVFYGSTAAACISCKDPKDSNLARLFCSSCFVLWYQNQISNLMPTPIAFMLTDYSTRLVLVNVFARG